MSASTKAVTRGAQAWLARESGVVSIYGIDTSQQLVIFSFLLSLSPFCVAQCPLARLLAGNPLTIDG